MREEREMKKGIQWLKEKIGALPCADTIFNSSGSRYIDSAVSIMAVYDLIDQLDESEALSQEESINIVLDDLKEYIKEQQSLSQNVGMAHTPAGNDTHYRQYDYVLECIDEYEPSDGLQNLLVPKQKLPVIPKFVANYIQISKDADLTLFAAMEKLIEGYENKVNNWLWDGSGDHSFQVFAKAWLAYPNIVVEEEQKYIIKIAERDFMVMDDDGVMYPVDINIHKYKYQFTEQEIKDYDERYIPFMVPVDEESSD